MADWMKPEQRRRNMAANRSSGNKTTELLLARLLRSAGVKGWRRHQPLPGRPDFVFRQVRLAVFVDGCFWHGCPRCFVMPGDNSNYWHLKIDRNRKRDRAVVRELRRSGWQVVRIWEHLLRASRGQKRALARVRAALADGAKATSRIAMSMRNPRT